MASWRNHKIINFRAMKGRRHTSSTHRYCSLSARSWLHKQDKDEINIVWKFSDYNVQSNKSIFA